MTRRIHRLLALCVCALLVAASAAARDLTRDDPGFTISAGGGATDSRSGPEDIVIDGTAGAPPTTPPAVADPSPSTPIEQPRLTPQPPPAVAPTRSSPKSTSGTATPPRESTDLTRHGIYTIRSDGSGLKLVLEERCGGTYAIPSPTGRHLYVYVDWRPDCSTLALGGWIMNSDGTGRRQIFSGSNHTPKWSPDGNWLAWRESSSNGDGALKIVPADGTLDEARTVLSGRSVGNFEWSPDAKRFAMTEGLEGRKGPLVDEHMFIIDRDGTNRIEMTDVVDDRLAWSPDGTEIAYYGPRDGDGFYGPRRLMAIRPDGTGSREITYVREGIALREWSGDGQRLVYFDFETMDVRTVRRDGSAAKTPFLPALSWIGGWSPANDQFVRGEELSGTNRISIADAADGQIVRVIGERANLYAYGWSREGVIVLSAMTPNPNAR
jgi:Tol biopolymer transport system component